MKQAYGSEPILFSSSPITSPPVPAKPPKKQRRLMGQRLVFGVAILIVAGAFAAFLIRHIPSSAPFTASIRRSASFALYYPGWLPKGYYVDQDSMSATSQVVTFSINSPTGKTLVVTEQPQPANMELSSFYSQNVTGSREVSAISGKVTLGRFETSQFTGIATGKTWILIRAVVPIDDSQLEHVSRNFKLAN